jgi:hypothetical protein
VGAVVTGMLLLATWILIIALTIWWYLTRLERVFAIEVTAPPPDPYAAPVAEFRREVHDWDRDGGPAA